VKLGCRRYGGAWCTYPSFKRREGLIELDGRWITAREKHFLSTIEKLRKDRQPEVILRRRTEQEYRVLAEKGLVEEGMHPEEVVLSLGFPDRVERKIHDGKELDQWCYAERFCYLYNGEVVVK